MSAHAGTDTRPRIALTLGDPAGIGPEIALAALASAEVRAAMRLVAIGPEEFRPESAPDFDSGSEDLAWLATPGPKSWAHGRPQADCGRAALDALAAGAGLAREGRVDALVTGPVSKEALHLAGEPVEGQTELLARWADVRRYEMIAIAGDLRVMLLTRHMPLRVALEHVHADAICERMRLFDETLRKLGVTESPRLALAGLNPHAGEHGLLGSEEADVLEPAVRTLRGEGLEVHGPVSPDVVFLDAAQGRFDGVLALYHDQAFIPLKLLSAGKGVTLVAGLPYLRVSPVHGTAFDIAGQGRASPENLIQALLQAARWASA